MVGMIPRRIGRSIIERLDRLVLSILPIQLTPSWVKLVRGQYAGDNASMYLRAAYWLKLNLIKGDIIEFGVGSGASFCLLYRYITRIDRDLSRRFLLFDSFEGLPEGEVKDQHPQWKTGAWCFDQAAVVQRGKRYGVDFNRVHVTPGYYDRSLTYDCARRLTLQHLALVHIDCDLFSSTSQALQFITPFVQNGTIALLDDYYCYSGNRALGEAGAFHEWCLKHNIAANPWFPYSLHGHAFILTPGTFE